MRSSWKRSLRQTRGGSFRFLVGPCISADPTPKRLFLGDLHDILTINADLQMWYEDKNIFRMRGENIT